MYQFFPKYSAIFPMMKAFDLHRKKKDMWHLFVLPIAQFFLMSQYTIDALHQL